MKFIRIPHYLGCIFIDDGNEALLDLLIFVQHLQVFRNLQKIFRVVIGICIRLLLVFIEVFQSALIDTLIGKLDNVLRGSNPQARPQVSIYLICLWAIAWANLQSGF